MVVRAEKQRARHRDGEKDSPRPSLPRQEQDSREKRRDDDDRHHVRVLPVRKADAKVRVRLAVHKGNRSMKRDYREREAGWFLHQRAVAARATGGSVRQVDKRTLSRRLCGFAGRCFHALAAQTIAILLPQLRAGRVAQLDLRAPTAAQRRAAGESLAAALAHELSLQGGKHAADESAQLHLPGAGRRTDVAY
jgi:hypothetical protein